MHSRSSRTQERLRPGQATGRVDATATARDTAGLTGSATQQVVSKQNLVGNPGFETNNAFVNNVPGQWTAFYADDAAITLG